MIKKFIFIFILLVAFAPKVHATVYYIDFVNGSDSNDGLGTTTKNAWQSLNKFANNARTCGDTAYVRRNQASTTNVTAVTVSSDGCLNNPITISGDYDNLWGDFSTLGITATPVFGATQITVSASSTAVHNSWIYFGNDCTENPATTSSTFINQKYNPCEFAYEVASSSSGVANTVLTLYMPYKGPTTGSGIAIRQMGKNPIVGDLSQANQIISMSNDDYWYFKGLDLRSTNLSCVMSESTSRGTIVYNTIFQGDGTTDCGLGGGGLDLSVFKSRLFGFVNATQSGGGNFFGFNIFSDFVIDCNNVSNSIALNNIGSFYTSLIKDGIIKNCIDLASNANGDHGGKSNFINVQSNSNLVLQTGLTPNQVSFEDKFGIVGLNSQTSNIIFADAVGTTSQATSTNLRSGGGPLNDVFFPSSLITGSFTGISTQFFPYSYIKLFEYPIYSTATSHTYTMYFNSTSTGNFTTNPLTTTASGSTTPELYIECEYYNDATDANRYLKRSTGGTVNFSGSTAWQSLSVQCSPTQAGILYLRGWYAKPTETNKYNAFYMDTTPVITTP